MTSDLSDDAPWARAAAALRQHVATWVDEDSANRSVNGLARSLGYRSPDSLRKALASDDGPKLRVLLGLASALGYRSIEELFGAFGTTGPIEDLRTNLEETPSTGR